MPAASVLSAEIPCINCKSKTFKPALNCEGFNFVKCGSCNLVQRNPQPVQEEITARYSKTFGNDYLSYELQNENAFLNLQQLGLKDAGFEKLEKRLLALPTQPHVLDIGCATGALLENLKARGWRVTGVEISPSAVYAREERKLDVRSLVLEENKFPDKTFDVVLASHLIEHLNDPGSFLQEVNRILKDNGYCFITTPNIAGFQSKIFKNKWRSAIFDHLYLFSVSTIKKLLKTKGFKIVSIHTWGGLAAGSAPKWLKKIADYWVKKFGCGDVMIVKAKKF